MACHHSHGHHRGIPSPEVCWPYQPLAVHEGIQYATQRTALAGVVLDVKQLESAESRGAQTVFHVSLVAVHRPFSRCLVEGVNLGVQPVLLEPVPEDFKVVGVEYARVLGQFLVVGINLELTAFVAHYRCLAQRHGMAEIPCCSGSVPVQYAAMVCIGKGKGCAHVGRKTIACAHSAGDVEVLSSFLRAFPAQVVVAPL